MTAAQALIAVAVILGGVLIGIAKALLQQQAKGMVPDITKKLARDAAAQLPPPHDEYYDVTWSGELDALKDKPLSALRFAYGLKKATADIAAELEPEAIELDVVEMRQAELSPATDDVIRADPRPALGVASGNVIARYTRRATRTAYEILDAWLSKKW